MVFRSHLDKTRKRWLEGGGVKWMDVSGWRLFGIGVWGPGFM